MKRKVNRVGQNTLTVSLPSKWAEKHNIKQGDEIELEEEENKLILYTGPIQPKHKEINITLTHNDWRYVRSMMGSIYKKGYDIIRINYEKEEYFKHIQNSVNSLMGFEIFEKQPGSCVIKCMTIDSKDEFQNTMSKLVNTTKTMRAIVREDYCKGVYKRFNELDEYRNSGWKYRDYAMRIAANNISDNPNTYNLIIIVWSLEKINRNYKRLYQVMEKLKSKKNEPFLELYDQISEAYDYFSSHLNKADFKSIEKINEYHDQIIEKGFEISEKMKKDNSLLIILLENIRRMQDLCSPLAMINY